MRMRDTFIKPMHPEGKRFVAAFAVVALILFVIWEPLGWIGVGLTIWCYYFFRDPERVVPDAPGLGIEVDEDLARDHPWRGEGLHLEMTEEPVNYNGPNAFRGGAPRDQD